MAETMRIGPWMKRKVVAIQASASVKEAAALLVDRRVGTLPVMDEAGMLVGMITITDAIHIFLPDFVSLVEDFDFVEDFGALRTPSPEDLEQWETLLVTDIMRSPVTVPEDCSLIRALSVLEKDPQLSDLLVVSNGQLVGVASRVDIARAFMSDWLERAP
jgi:CBS domain-containing protein